MVTSKELWIAYTRIFFVELAYWIVSIGMVFVNEFILGSKLLSDDLTVFVTFFQILFSLSILVSLNYITKTYLNPALQNSSHDNVYSYTHSYQLNHQNNKEQSASSDSVTLLSQNAKLIDNDDELDNNNNNNNNEQPALNKNSKQEQTTNNSNDDGLMSLFVVNIPGRINFETCKLVFPLSILYVGMLLLNNFCLKYVGVAFYFVSRSLTTVFNIIFTYFLMNEPVSRGALICCILIVLGFILGIDQESVIGSLSIIGTIFGVASSLFTSLFSIYTKKTLAKLNKNIWVLVLYNNINAILLCTPLLIIHGDVQALISDKVVSTTFWFLLSVSGIMAFFISIVTNASIKYTSPLTHNISGTAKACLQTVIAVIYQHDHKSTLWWISNMIILVASAAYSRIKQLEMGQKVRQLSKQKSTETFLPNNNQQDNFNNYMMNATTNTTSYSNETEINNYERRSSTSSISSYEIQPDSDCCSIKFDSSSD